MTGSPTLMRDQPIASSRSAEPSRPGPRQRSRRAQCAKERTLTSGFGRGRGEGRVRVDAELHHLRFDDVLVALWADGVAELGVGMLADVGLDLLPVVLIVANLSCSSCKSGAGRQAASRKPAPRAIRLDALGERLLQLHHLLADADPGEHLGFVERLGDVIIRSGLAAP